VSSFFSEDDKGIVSEPTSRAFATASSTKRKSIRKKKTFAAQSQKSGDDAKSNKKFYRSKADLKKKKPKKEFRADRVLSDRGVGTRSEAHKLIKQKRIDRWDEATKTRVRISGPSEKVTPDAKLFQDNIEIPGVLPLLVAHHKPKYVLSTMEFDRSERRHLGQLLPPMYDRGKIRMHPVGRLDYETTGLIFFSSNGDLTQWLLHPKHEIEKEYVATVEGGTVNLVSLRNKLNDGVETAEGTHVASLLEAIPLGQERIEAIKNDLETRKDDKKEEHTFGKIDFSVLTEVRLVVQEGKHRMVRRMLANCGHPVLELRRERHGAVSLDDLPEGEFRELDEDEMRWAEGLLKSRK
jgi:23S rRNA pseudouridine2605 synthase